MASGDYTKTTWNEGLAPGISGANLNNLEKQFEEAAYIPSARMIPPVVRWVMPGWYGAAAANQVVTANRTYYMPIYIPESVSYDRIGINVQAGDGAGGVADLRIFEWDTGVPGDLVLSAGTVSTNAGGAKEIVIAETLNGLYFLAIRCDQTPTIWGINLTGAPPVAALSTTNAGGVIQNAILYDDGAYADPAGIVDGFVSIAFAFPRLREA